MLALLALVAVQGIDTLFAPYTGAAVPGASVVVVRDGRVVLRRAYGSASLDTREPATPATNYRLASLTKQFTAMAVMLLERDGRLRYDQPVREILPELPPAAQPVTLRHLLNHTSGLWDYEDLIPDTQTVQVSDADVLALMSRKDTLYFAPGSTYRYSNSGYVLLGLVVERISGTRFAQFLHDRIFAPFGMTATVAHVEGVDTVPRRAYGYTPTEGSSPPGGGGGFTPSDQSVTSATLGDGGVYSNVDDLVRWDQALYGIRLVITPPYGFGWFVDTYCGERRWRHHGETSGFRNEIQRFPERRFTVIVLTNRNGGEPRAIAERIADHLLFAR